MDLVTFTEEILNGKLHFLCSVNPRDLEMSGEKKEVAREMVAQALKRLVLVSNLNITQNADYLFSKMEVEPEVKWIEKDKIRVNSSKYKTLY